MEVLSPKMEHFHLRNLFHEIDENGDGVIDVNEFLESFDAGKMQAEE